MSTFTTNYGFIKPDLLEEADAETLTFNVQQATYALNRVKQATASEFDKKLHLCMQRTANMTGIVNDDETWVTATNSWSSIYNANNGFLGESGSMVNSTTGTIGWIQPGYYRLSYQVAINSGNTTHIRGAIRAGIFYWDNNLGLSQLIPNTLTSVPVDTYLGITTCSLETIIRVKEQNDLTSKEIFVHSDNDLTTFLTSGSPDWTWELRVGQKNSGGGNTTGTLIANETWMAFEFVRPL